MNAITPGGGSTAVAALSSLKAGLQNVQQTLIKKGGDPFLRLGKDGFWVYGQEDTEVEEGSLWAANPLSIMHGYVAWERGDKADNSGGPKGEMMVPASTPLPPKHTLTDVGAPWEQQFSVMLRCTNGTDEGEQVLYKTASVGGVAAFDELIKAILAQADRGTDKIVPLLDLQVDSYKHPKYGKIFIPVLKIKDWLTFEGEGGEASTEPEPVKQAEPEPAKPTRQRRASVPVTETKPVEQTQVASEADMKAARAAELRRQLEELEAGGGQQAAPEPQQAEGQPMRRRRNPA